MKYYNGQIINPEKFRVPTYNISPFSVDKLRLLDDIKKKNESQIDDKKLIEQFGDHEFTLNGKDAIFKSLSFYDLKPDDEVYIVTTSGNKYVSSCVTGEIEKYCKWSREISQKTKLIFLVHEFGTILKQIDEILALNLPIIEDLAMSMFSNNAGNQAGSIGDFVIYSLPKFLPIQFGGILKYNKKSFKKAISNEKTDYQISLQKISADFLGRKAEIIARRKANYNYYQDHFKALNIETRLQLTQFETPSVYMFSTDKIDLDRLKIYMQDNGVECGKFYGENTFFLPVHQELEEFDLNFIINLIKYFIIENK